MQQLSRDQVQTLLQNKPKNISDRQIIESLTNRGYQLEGLNQNMPQDSTVGGLQKTSNILGSVFGGQKIGEAIGTQFAKLSEGGRELAAQEKAGIAPVGTTSETLASPKPSQLIGDTIRTAATFAPVGKAALGLSKAAGALGLGVKTSNILGNVGAGAVTGAAFDVGSNLAEKEKATIGVGTLLGAGIPIVSPIIGALGRAVSKVSGRATSEITGALTGTSQETIEQAFLAAKKGGSDLETFTNSLRGKTTPEQLVNTVRENVSAVSKDRTQLFTETLNELGDIKVMSYPAKDKFTETLNKFKINIDENGALNFTKSELRTLPEAQKKIIQAWNEIINIPEQVSLGELDTTRQAIKAIKSIAGDDPSANKANTLIEDAVRSVRSAGEQVEGYGKMLDNFGETSDFLDELAKGLSTGDRTTIDQAYRRIATTLKTNNEQRMALVKELDEVTGGSILADISGQQLSEALPRGIFRQISAGIAGGAAVTGTLSPALLPSLIFASPRVVGEFARALGIASAKTNALISAIGDVRNVLIKTGAIVGSNTDDTDN